MTQKGGHLSSNSRALTRYGRVVPAKVGKEYEEGAKRRSRNEKDGITCQSSRASNSLLVPHPKLPLIPVLTLHFEPGRILGAETTTNLQHPIPPLPLLQ